MDKIPQDYCLLCGKCLEVCPVFNVTQLEEYSPRAKAFVYSQIQKKGLDIKNVDKILGNCVGCLRCYEVCTQGIDIPDKVANIRSLSPTFKRWLYLKIVKYLPELSPLIKNGFKIKDIIPHLKKIKELGNFFENRNKKGLFKINVFKNKKQKQRAIIFGGCVGTYLKKNWLEAASNIAGLFYNVEGILKWECCGYPMFFAGDIKGAREVFNSNVKLWQQLGNPKILVFCATCWSYLRKNASLIEDETLRDDWLSSLTYMTELIANIESIEITENSHKFLFHKPCHLDDKLHKSFLEFLDNFKIKYRSLSDCCGFGGCTRLENPRLCDMLGERFWENVAKDEIIVSGCSGCIMQFCLTGDFKRVYHWLELFEF